MQTLICWVLLVGAALWVIGDKARAAPPAPEPGHVYRLDVTD